MARRHGWQLPAHPFQVLAIVVFFLLSVAFYVFFAPFIGKEIYQYGALGIYSFLVLCVFFLYIRCTAIDPADPGILVEADKASAYESPGDAEFSGHRSCMEESRKGGFKKVKESDRHHTDSCMKLGKICCCLVKEDCCEDEDNLQQKNREEDELFCTLCNAEVRKFSKHCRSCDKCVDGFDHHCRWLNNCVGRKNYVTFFCLMAASLVWLTFEFGVGIAVLVHCFVNRRAAENQISQSLGDGFSLPPFATVVALCTALSFLATVPLGELLFFHIILIRKGITTYEYVVAMRTQSEPPGQSIDGDDQQQSFPSSPTSSAVTGISGRSSVGIGLKYRNAWCTPPRIFMDHQDEIIPHLEPYRHPSTVDPDAIPPPTKGKKVDMRSVRINPWKLAKLDSNEAIKAGAKARALSSVLLPISSRHQHSDTDQLSSAMSGKSSPANTHKGYQERNGAERISRVSSSRSSYPPSRASREEIVRYGRSASELNSPQLPNASILVQPQTSNTEHFNPMYQSSAGQSPCSAMASGGNETATHDLVRIPERRINLGLADHSTSNSVCWDQESGRFVSVSSQRAGSSQVPRTEFMYTTQSIFFGGPLGSDSTLTRAPRSSGITLSGQLERGSNYYQRQQGTSQRGGQLPVFVPSDSQQHHFPSRLK